MLWHRVVLGWPKHTSWRIHFGDSTALKGCSLPNFWANVGTWRLSHLAPGDLRTMFRQSRGLLRQFYRRPRCLQLLGHHRPQPRHLSWDMGACHY
jgi:hypothetical protein